MANITVKFNGKEFLLSCEDGQEEHLDELSLHLNNRFNKLKNDLGNIGENKLLLITSIKIMDEYFETKKKIDQKKQELRDLSNKFRKLRSLVYEYKDKKEQEIKKEQLDNTENEEFVEYEISRVLKSLNMDKQALEKILAENQLEIGDLKNLIIIEI